MSFSAQKPHLLSVQKIWDSAPHNALTDLIFFQNRWFCTFREGFCHYKGNNGKIRVISSTDGTYWTSYALFEEENIDLRDPKLSITPDGKLMLLCGGTTYSATKSYISRQPRVAFSNDGISWTPFELILSPHEWLWRVTWYKETAYGVSYRPSAPYQPQKEWIITLFSSRNGIHYSPVTELNVPGRPNETTLRFTSDGEMIALVRRDKVGDDAAWIGSSPPPYTEWKWKKTRDYFGGPNFLIFPDGTMWAGGRIVSKTLKNHRPTRTTWLAEMGRDYLKPVLQLPSGGDTSYPGMVLKEGTLWMSYYSSHESDKTSIYLAKIGWN